MESITFEKAKAVFEKEGVCNDGDYTYISNAVEYLLTLGGGNIQREWEVVCRYGRFTLPPDLCTPVKYKLGTVLNSGFGSIHSAYFSYGSNSIQSRVLTSYNDWGINIELKPYTVATKFRPPACGLRLVLTTRNTSDVGEKVIVSGSHKGFEIISKHNGKTINGELLTIYHEEDPDKKYSAYIFDNITAVAKDKLCDWIMLSGLSTVSGEPYFLSHYHPDETNPVYREAELYLNNNSPLYDRDFVVSIIGKIKTGFSFTRDEEVLPIDSGVLLTDLAKRAYYHSTNQFDALERMEARIENYIQKYVAYKVPYNEAMTMDVKSARRRNTNV